MKHLTLTIALILSLVIASCQSDLHINEIIDQNSVFNLTVVMLNPETGLDTYRTEEIKMKSAKWNKLIDFTSDNMEGWQSSLASYIGDIYVSQGDFRLIYTKGSNRVAIAFIDKNDDPKQYTKKITKGELDFLAD